MRVAYSQYSLRIVTSRAQYEFLNKNIEHLLQFARFVRSVDDEAIVFEIELCLCSQFTAKKLGRIFIKIKGRLVQRETAIQYYSNITSWGSSKRFSYFSHVDNDRLNTVAFALNLGDDAGHFVTIKCI